MGFAFDSGVFDNRYKVRQYVEDGRVYNCPERIELNSFRWHIWKEEYSGEKVRESLWELAEQPQDNKNSYVFLYLERFRKKGFCESLLCVDPVFAALVLEDYECAEKLLDIGFGIAQEESEKFMLLNEDIFFRSKNIYLSQLLFISDIPTELYRKIWEKMPFRNYAWKGTGKPCKFYDLEQDYLNNPLVTEENCWENLTELLEKHYRIVPEGLGGSSSNDNNSFFQSSITYMSSFPIALNVSAADIIIRLLQIFQMKNDVKHIIEHIAWYYLHTEKRASWLNVVLKVSENCIQRDGVREGLVNSLFELLMQCWEDKFWDESLEKCEKKVLRELKVLCAPEYTQEELLRYVGTKLSNFYSTAYVWDLLTMWRKDLKRELYVHRADTYLQVLFNKATDRTLESLDRSLDDLMTLLEALSGVDDTGLSQGEIEEETRIVMEDILRTDSEEALVLCWKKGIMTKETLPMVSELAIKEGHTKLIPLLIYLQATANSKNACP